MRKHKIDPGETAQQRKASSQAISAPSFSDGHCFEGEITFTYCTECIVLREDTGKNSLALRAYLETIGDCVVVVEDDDIIKVHVHTDNTGNAMQHALG